LAAKMAGEQIDISAIRRDLVTLASGHQGLVVEGAGGTLVPINEQQTIIDLMVALDLPVVLVARGSLGTINHSLLSVQALQNAGLDVLGIVFCDATPCEDDFIRRDNPETIARFAGVNILGDIPYRCELTAEDISDKAWDDFKGQLSGFEELMNVFR
ncbi:MAG TPA: dethiobiotin synthase, partial [Phycisphaerae bacterium]|nr:dethiobiotin synthase [Phycisphaerae bacterium]